MYRLVSILAFERTVDTVVWQMLASVICPGMRCSDWFSFLSVSSWGCENLGRNVIGFLCACAGYTIHTIVWATHATLVPVEVRTLSWESSTVHSVAFPGGTPDK